MLRPGRHRTMQRHLGAMSGMGRGVSPPLTFGLHVLTAAENDDSSRRSIDARSAPTRESLPHDVVARDLLVHCASIDFLLARIRF